MIIFIGDVHGDYFSIRNFILSMNIRNTTFIQVGDFGLGFYNLMDDIKSLDDLNKILIKSDNILYIIRGNHDNPQFWVDAEDWNLSNLKLIPDYTEMVLEDKKFFFVGGGLSIDRSTRTLNKDYWPHEVIMMEEDLPTDVDVLVTHAPHPNIFSNNNDNLNYWIDRDKTLIESLRDENLKLKVLGEKIKPKVWVSGHLHWGETVIFHNCTYVSLGINEFKELL